MNPEDVLDEIIRALRVQMNEVADFLANGMADSYEMYKDRCGYLQGLGFAESQCFDLKKRFVNGDLED